MKELSVSEIREMQLLMMDKIHDYCINNNLKYSLYAGTLLGAVRHKGFIPWDDDFDIMMPRPDYEKFIRNFNEVDGNLMVESCYTNPDYVSAFAKVVDLRTVAAGPNIIDDRYLFIDVFPVDGMPTDENKCDYAKVCKIMEQMRQAGKYYKYERNVFSKIQYFIKYWIKRLYVPSLSRSRNKLSLLIQKYPFGKGSYAGVLVGMAGLKERLPIGVYSEYTNIAFENRTYLVIKEYATCLTIKYGDYMTPPPENERIGMHFSKVYYIG